ncbi:MAG: type II secretion system GspH family protein, partial [Synergistaceae bacterium]|nr:type II secretion system GspH family protein [Synergistaceae bacterium]
MRRRRAFSFPELLISMIILGILGGSLVTALWIFWGTYWQDEDYIEARSNIERIFQFLTPEITNVGLGMPNNRSRTGSFTAAFEGQGSNDPIMAQMGDPTRADGTWGGPITLASDPNDYTSAGKVTALVSDPDHGRNVYVGPVLYYTWAVPTGVK